MVDIYRHFPRVRNSSLVIYTSKTIVPRNSVLSLVIAPFYNRTYKQWEWVSTGFNVKFAARSQASAGGFLRSFVVSNPRARDKTLEVRVCRSVDDFLAAIIPH